MGAERGMKKLGAPGLGAEEGRGFPLKIYKNWGSKFEDSQI